MTAGPATAWRVFPWDPQAGDGEPFSPGWAPPVQGHGRFDLPASPGGVIYLAETPVHAVAEVIQHFRGQPLDEADLRAAGRPLALARAVVSPKLRDRLADLCDPRLLTELGVGPDETASADRRTTQAIAARLHAAGYAGIRWWSALRGDWHTWVMFRDRTGDGLRFEAPEPLSVEHPAVRDAMRELGIRASPQHPGAPPSAPRRRRS